MDNVKETPFHKAVVSIEQQANKQKQPAVDHIILEAPTIEVRGLDKSPSSFSFQSEIQKLGIPLPLIEPLKNESFNKSIFEALKPKAIQASTDYVNL